MSRFNELAYKLINYSIELKPGEKVLLEITGRETELAAALIREAYAAGGQPFLQLSDASLEREWLMGATAEQLEAQSGWETARMSRMDAYIGVRISQNPFELSDVPKDRLALYKKLVSEPVHSKLRVPKTKWVVLRYPNPSMAQAAGMSTAAFAEHYFKVCLLDYAKLSRAMDPLAQTLNHADRVRLSGPKTDLSFSIKGIGAVKCDGHRNIPDGEVYTAPVADSTEGYITFNTPSHHEGVVYKNICLKLSGGRIIGASCDNMPDEALSAIFDIDEGARYIGEFAFGLNPHIKTPIGDTLFDEKIGGSFHFTPGAAYETADNGIRSALHWDLVSVQCAGMGGGEIWIDGRLVLKDGLFVPEELLGLNPDRLLAGDC